MSSPRSGFVQPYAALDVSPLRGLTPVNVGVKFRFAPLYFVDTIKYAHMGRTKAQAEHQESQA